MDPKYHGISLHLGKTSHIFQNMREIDHIDRRILSELQRDCDQPLEALGERVALSRNAVWRRIRAMDEAGIIRARVALLDPHKLGLGLSVVILIRTSEHSAAWQTAFRRATSTLPAILTVERMTGDLDYMIRARVADMADYDRLYQSLIDQVDIADVSASFVMEEIKESTALPL